MEELEVDNRVATDLDLELKRYKLVGIDNDLSLPHHLRYMTPCIHLLLTTCRVLAHSIT